jgi:hypothetical protein
MVFRHMHAPLLETTSVCLSDRKAVHPHIALNVFFPAISGQIDLKFSKNLQVNLHCLFFLLSSSSESSLFPQNLNLFAFARLNNLLGGGVVGDKSTPWTWAVLKGAQILKGANSLRGPKPSRRPQLLKGTQLLKGAQHFKGAQLFKWAKLLNKVKLLNTSPHSKSMCLFEFRSCFQTIMKI